MSTEAHRIFGKGSSQCNLQPIFFNYYYKVMFGFKWLATGNAWSYDAESMSKVQKIIISFNYTPISSNVQVDLKDSNEM